MAPIHLEAARDVDRDALLQVLEERGLEAHPVDEDDRLVIEIRCDGEQQRSRDELLDEVESWIADSGLPLVPLKQDGCIFLRPPAD